MPKKPKKTYKDKLVDKLIYIGYTTEKHRSELMKWDEDHLSAVYNKFHRECYAPLIRAYMG